MPLDLTIRHRDRKETKIGSQNDEKITGISSEWSDQKIGIGHGLLFTK